jgi:hypothetical protein
MLDAFDAANGLKSTPQRYSTTTPVQSLLMFNSPVTLDRAKEFANKLMQQDYLWIICILSKP